ncbi:hypothetical protein FA15DRAFT_672513 [Coprinopsis marcescibilis]|uniref:Uncharacterized protein n=1 Tax=Coprinopsis marcescibilis TaxID=230819 RepID=A0A5C3KM80_COPMA|nr:hypothetical protein FA15DRAFT_672513 [Coprinopsis marcescibilis]
MKNSLWTAEVVVDPSLVSYVKSSNDPLPEELFSVAKTAVGNLSTSLSDLDHQIAGLEDAIRDLRIRRDSVKEAHIALCSLWSPVRRIPSELISQIMEMSLFSKREMLDKEERQHFSNMRCVSRRWRSAAFATPKLWRGIQLNLQDSRLFPNTAFSDVNGMQELLSRWFDRAGQGAPLRFGLFNGQPHEYELFSQPSLYDQALISFLSSAQYTWNFLLIDSGPVIEGLYYIDVESVPRGTRLVGPTSTAKELSTRWVDTTVSLGARFPSLRSLFLAANRLSDFPRSPEILSHGKIRSLHLFGFILESWDVVGNTISALHSLEELILDTIKLDPAPSTYCLKHPHIKTLVLVNHTSLCETLQPFVFPALTYFRLAQSDGAVSSSLSDLDRQACDQFLRRSKPISCTLSLERYPLSMRKMAKLISHIPHITRLHVASPVFLTSKDPELLQKLDPSVTTVVCKRQPTPLGSWKSSLLAALKNTDHGHSVNVYVPASRSIPSARDQALEDDLRNLGINLVYCRSETLDSMLWQDIIGHFYIQRLK